MTNNPYEKLEIFIGRLKKLGIEIKIGANIPWIYLDYINGKRVTEKHNANHGFNIAWLNYKDGIVFDDIKATFDLIRKYTKDDKSKITK